MFRNVGLNLACFSVGIFVLLLPVSHSRAKAWRSIVPLHSSKADVQDLLGNALRSGKYTSSYELVDEIVEFVYAKGGRCGSTLVDSWRVAPGTVVNIRVVPKTDMAFRNHQPFLRVQDSQQNSISYHSDLQKGIRYTVENRADGEHVLSIDYLPAAVDRYLNCSERLYTQAPSVPIFEQYGSISPESEKAILDNFAIQLLNDRELTGYIVLRRGQYSSKFAAKKLLWIKNYLFKRRQLHISRVTAFEGRPQRAFTVELYLVPKGKPGPT